MTEQAPPPPPAQTHPGSSTPRKVRKDPLIGVVLADRYRVLEPIGEGGMGSVYVGEHVTLDKRVALKVLKQELGGDKTIVERFLREAKATSRIEHENVVEILDFGYTPDNSAFFVMEFLRGQELTELMLELGRVSWYRAKPILLQICRGLGAAHDAGIIHRDMKPGNVFLTRRSGKKDFVKILDFGIAKVEDAAALTRAGMVFGTAAYMAPEQATADELDGRADMYAVACVAYEMLTGRLPFDAKHPIKMLNCHIREPAPSMGTRAPEAKVPVPVDTVILKGLSKLPDERYANMYEFAAALEAIPRGEPPRERPRVFQDEAKVDARAMKAAQDTDARRQELVERRRAERDAERTEPRQIVFPQGGGPPEAAPVAPQAGPAPSPSPASPEPPPKPPPRPQPRRAPITAAMTSPPPAIPGGQQPFPPELPGLTWLFVGLHESGEGFSNDDLITMSRRLARWSPDHTVEQVNALVRHTLADYRALPDVATRGARTREYNMELAKMLPRQRLAEVLSALYEIASDDGVVRDQELRFIVNATTQFGLSPDPRLLGIAFLYLTLCMADGFIDEAEKLVLRESASRWAPDASIAERAVVIRWAIAEFHRRPSYEEKLIVAREAADRLAHGLDPSTLRTILADLWRIAGADGHIAPEERAFIAEMVQRFGVS